MKVEYLAKFNKDIDKLRNSRLLASLYKLILHVELANSISEIPNIKKLSGHKNAYRIKIGDYRIGIFYEKNIIEFARIVHRKDIYDVFP